MSAQKRPVTTSTTPKSAPLKMYLPLFWRLFLSLLFTILLTSMVSILVERWLNERALTQRIEVRVEQLLIQRGLVVDALKKGDLTTVSELYEQDRRFMYQISIYDEQAALIFPKYGRMLPRYNSRNQEPSKEAAPTTRLDAMPSTLAFRNPNMDNTLINIDNRPEMADTLVTLPNGQTLTLQIRPHLRYSDVKALQRSNFIVRVILIILFSVLMCFWLSRTLILRIRQVQDTVRQMIGGRYHTETDISELGTDELGQLAKDVAQLSTRLQDSELARKQMLSDISHELRSPLARLEVATELARDFAPTAERYLNRIDKESARMDELIEQIIHIQSLQMQQYVTNLAEKEPVNIARLISDIAQDVCFEFQNKPVYWQWQMSDGLQKLGELNSTNHLENWRVMGNPEQLHSALENVIRNAFIHTKPHSSVTAKLTEIKTDNDNTALQISIIDEGDGIAEDDLQRIFQPFVRLDSARQRQTGGYGLGLAIVHAVIMAHQGHIDAYNRKEGTQGLVIQIVLPKL